MTRSTFNGLPKALAGALVLFALAAPAPAALAGGITQNDMVKALSGKVRTRSIVVQGNSDKSRIRKIVKDLQRPTTRAIAVEARQEIAKVVKVQALPALDLSVLFDYNSARISPKSIPVLIKLGEALNHAQLAHATFLVGGHTDARGSDAYNLTLSQLRAHSVRRFLIEKFGISAKRLVAVGFGEEQLKNTYDPEAGENRRVQLVNLAS